MSEKKSANRIRIKITKKFNCAPEKVFDAWLKPEILSQWMIGPEVREEEIVKLENDPREGGTFSFVVRRGDDVLDHMGTYREIKRPVRLVFTWGVNVEAGDESVVTVEIVPSNNGCQLTLIHEMDPKWAEYAERTREGWTYMLGKLDAIIG